MNSESKPSSSTVARERLDAARALRRRRPPRRTRAGRPRTGRRRSCAASLRACDGLIGRGTSGSRLSKNDARALEQVVGREDPDRASRARRARPSVERSSSAASRGAWPRGRRAGRAAAISSPISRRSRDRPPAGTTSLTRPIRAASSASSTRPVRMQLLRPRHPDDPRQALRAAGARRDREAHLGQPELRPLGRDPEVAARASSRPPPRALPSIAAIVGIGRPASRVRDAAPRARAARGRPGRAAPRTRRRATRPRTPARPARSRRPRGRRPGSAASRVASAASSSSSSSGSRG